ncbi:MAG TPA: tRNA epoxyqueuosine(34) reductase QueG [Gemmatimonadaceae bacterium]|nr:tRNA epoxyqueuosine(34) reductase QueG [Gemmatimonadaceae bacterium]
MTRAVEPPRGGEAAALATRLKAQAYGIGFDLAGIAPLGPAASAPHYDEWLARGFAASMDYMHRHADLRRDASRPQPGMRSALVVALDYGGREPAGPVARYARGDDYHRVMWRRLDALGDWLRAEAGAATRAFVDTGPVLERELARRAGLGWFGKNTMLINPRLGSFFFIGALFTELTLPPDAPFEEDHCGTCRRCLDACPTEAFAAPRMLDAARCISYLTIEHRGAIDPALAPLVGDHLYGCDVCQEVCPWNRRFARELREPAFRPRPAARGADAVSLAREWLAMDDAAYAEAFRNSAMKRAKRAGLRRNAEVVIANREAAASIPAPGPAPGTRVPSGNAEPVPRR